MKRYKAFTLIELLIAVSIFAIIALCLYSTFSGGIRVWRKQQEGFVYGHATRLALDKMARELRNAIIYSVPAQTTPGAEDTQGLRFIGEDKKASFITVVGGAIAKVTYLLDVESTLGSQEEEGPRGVLKRIMALPLQKGGFKEEGQSEEILVRGLKDVLFEYASAGEEKDSPPSWKNAWGTEDEKENKRLPQGVRITLTFQKVKEKKKDEPTKFIDVIFKKTVFMPMGIPSQQAGPS